MDHGALDKLIEIKKIVKWNEFTMNHDPSAMN